MAIQKLKGMPEAPSTQYKIPQKRGSTQVAEARAQAQRVKSDHRDLVHDQGSHTLHKRRRVSFFLHEARQVGALPGK